MNGSEHRLLRVASELMFCVRLCQKSHKIYCRKSEKQYNVFDIFALPLSHAVLTSFFCILVVRLVANSYRPTPFTFTFTLLSALLSFCQSESWTLAKAAKQLILRRFYRAMLCIRGTSHGPVSVRLSGTSRCYTKTAKRRITQTPHDSQGL